MHTCCHCSRPQNSCQTPPPQPGRLPSSRPSRALWQPRPALPSPAAARAHRRTVARDARAAAAAAASSRSRASDSSSLARAASASPSAAACGPTAQFRAAEGCLALAQRRYLPAPAQLGPHGPAPHSPAAAPGQRAWWRAPSPRPSRAPAPPPAPCAPGVPHTRRRSQARRHTCGVLQCPSGAATSRTRAAVRPQPPSPAPAPSAARAAVRVPTPRAPHDLSGWACRGAAVCSPCSPPEPHAPLGLCVRLALSLQLGRALGQQRLHATRRHTRHDTRVAAASLLGGRAGLQPARGCLPARWQGCV
jgi:hypothetical protein